MFFKLPKKSRISAAQRTHQARGSRSRRLSLEPLEDRRLLAVITVTGTGDTVAVDGAVTLREAITSANNNASVNADVVATGAYGTDTINFNIPGIGVRTIQPSSALPGIIDPVVIDGYTQPGAMPNSSGPFTAGNAVLLIELNGASTSGAAGLSISTSNSTIRGLVINRFGAEGIHITGSGNLILGNYIGTDPTGTMDLGVGFSGVSIVAFNRTGADNNRVGGTDPADRNVLVGSATGMQVASTPPGSGNHVLGNFIGTNAAGTASIANNSDGVRLFGASGTTIRGNLISGNTGHGIKLVTDGVAVDSSNTMIQGNRIGISVTGEPLPNSAHGIGTDNSSGDRVVNNLIGGTDPAEANIIAFNGVSGVALAFGFGTRILGNSIFVNGGLGIDLGGGDFAGDGVTPNDPGDTDAGPNNLQNFPVITSVSSAGGSTTVTGTLNSEAGKSYLIQFFANDLPDPSSHGEGQQLLGETTVTTDGSGNASFNPTLPLAVTPTQFVTSTATRLDAEGAPLETSEFSEVRADVSLTKSDAPDPVAVGQDLVYTLIVSNAGPFPAINVSLSDTLHGSVTFVSASTTQGTFTQTGTNVTFSLGTLTVGQSVTATITVRPTQPGEITNSATVTGAPVDPDTSNNSAGTTTNVLSEPAGTDLSVTKSDSPDPVLAGQNLTYTITVNNNSGDAQSVTLTDLLPAGTTLVSVVAPQGWTVPAQHPPGSVSASIDTLLAGAMAVFTLVVNVNSTVDAGTTLSNTATISSETSDTNLDNNSDTESTHVCNFVVTNTNDSGPGSLRGVIECANEVPGAQHDQLQHPGH